MTTEARRRFEELSDMIAISRDADKFSALVEELNQLDPTRHQPIIWRQSPTNPALHN